MRAVAKSSVLKRLRRIEGQVRGLARMVEDDRYCIDVVTLLSAVRGEMRIRAALKSAYFLIAPLNMFGIQETRDPNSGTCSTRASNPANQ